MFALNTSFWICFCRSRRPLGLDLEWNFSRRSGQTYKTALVQLCSTNLIIVMQISSMRQLPPSLVRIRSDPSIIKTGVAIRNDAMKLQRDFDLRARNVVELSTLAKLVDPVRWAGRNTLISLKDLCKVYLGRSLKKDATRVSDWTKVPLQPIQIECECRSFLAPRHWVRCAAPRPTLPLTHHSILVVPSTLCSH